MTNFPNNTGVPLAPIEGREAVVPLSKRFKLMPDPAQEPPVQTVPPSLLPTDPSADAPKAVPLSMEVPTPAPAPIMEIVGSLEDGRRGRPATGRGVGICIYFPQEDADKLRALAGRFPGTSVSNVVQQLVGALTRAADTQPVDAYTVTIPQITVRL
jgi:hypothetical protein